MRISTYLPGLEPEEWHTEPALRVLLLGGGVQSTAVALLAEQGAFGIKPDVAIFADTMAEPAHVYGNIDWIRSQVSYPVLVVDNERSLYEDVWNGVNQNGTPHILLPVFVDMGDGRGRGMMRRQCTSRYKIQVIRRKVREMLREKLGTDKVTPNCVEQWMGISRDEVERMRDSDVRYVYHYYSLIESLGWNRTDCARWLRRQFPQREVKKSACVFCPYHDDRIWAEMKEHQPEDFARAVALDKRLRSEDYPMKSTRGYARYLHPKMRPLDEVEFEVSGEQVNQFINECEGHCGV